MTKPHVSTVIDDDDDTAQCETLLNQLAIAEGPAATALAPAAAALPATKVAETAAAKPKPITASSTIDDYLTEAARRDAFDSARAKAAKARSVSARDNAAKARSVDTTRTGPNFFEKVSAKIRNFGSPLNGDGKEAINVITDTTPRTGMGNHANDMSDELFRPLEEGMTFGPETDSRPDPLTTRAVNFDTPEVSKRFNFGTPSPATNQAHPVTNHTHPAYAQKIPPANNQAHPAHPAPTAYVQNIPPVNNQAHPPAAHQANSPYAQNNPPAVHQANSPYAQNNPPAAHQANSPYAQNISPAAHQANSLYAQNMKTVYNNDPTASTPNMGMPCPPQDKPPTYQASSPYIMNENQHPNDIKYHGPRINTEQDYENAIQRGLAERSPRTAYQGDENNEPSYATLSNVTGPFTQNLVPSPHYSVATAMSEFHRMNPNMDPDKIAENFRSPNGSNPSYVPTAENRPRGIMKTATTNVPKVVALPPHTTTSAGYGYPNAPAPAPSPAATMPSHTSSGYGNQFATTPATIPAAATTAGYGHHFAPSPVPAMPPHTPTPAGYGYPHASPVAGMPTHTSANPYGHHFYGSPFGVPPTSGYVHPLNATQTGYGYAHPGYSSNPPPPPPPTPPASYMHMVPPTPYSHHPSFAYGNQSQATSLGTSIRGIKIRNSVSRKDLHWNGEVATFEAYKNRIFGIMQQNGTAYLGNGKFLTEYMLNQNHIHSGVFWDRFGITVQQCMSDISWLNGVLTTSIDNPENIPELNSANGDGVIALANLAAVYSNNGETEQETRWKIRDEIQKIFNPSLMSLPEYMRNFQTYVLKHQRYDIGYGREEVLDQLKKNIVNVIPNMEYHFDVISQRLDPWVTEIQYLARKAPKTFNRRVLDSTGRHQNGIFPTHLNTVSTNDTKELYRVNDIDELKDIVNKTFHVFKDKFTAENKEYPTYSAYRAVYSTFKNDPTRLNLSIPAPLWMKLDENIKKQIIRIRQEIRDVKDTKDKKDKATIGKQYPSLDKPTTDVRQTMNALSFIREMANSELFDDEDSISDMCTDDDENIFDHIRHIKMTSAHGAFWDDDNTIDIKANFRLVLKCVQDGKFYAISDGGADSCILGSCAHVINFTKRYARLVGYDPETTQSARVPIVSAYIKTKDKSGQIILMIVHEAPYLKNSPTTLLSEYQIREYGKVIDSCAETHVISSNPRLMGKQRFEINDDVHIHMEDRGAIMGIPILQYEEDDDKRYPIFEITSKATWVPYRYRHAETSTTSTNSNSTLVAAAVNAAKTEILVETVDDDDALTQRYENTTTDDEVTSTLMPTNLPALSKRHDGHASWDEGDSLSASDFESTINAVMTNNVGQTEYVLPSEIMISQNNNDKKDFREGR
jgi:hypothetical protein